MESRLSEIEERLKETECERDSYKDVSQVTSYFSSCSRVYIPPLYTDVHIRRLEIFALLLTKRLKLKTELNSRQLRR